MSAFARKALVLPNLNISCSKTSGTTQKHSLSAKSEGSSNLLSIDQHRMWMEPCAHVPFFLACFLHVLHCFLTSGCIRPCPTVTSPHQTPTPQLSHGYLTPELGSPGLPQFNTILFEKGKIVKGCQH